MFVEAALGLLLAILVFRRFTTLLVRLPLVLAVVAYVAVPVYFVVTLGEAA